MKASSRIVLCLSYLILSLFLSPKALHAQISSTVISSSPITEGWGEWRSLHTKHFSIHFPKKRREYAYKAAALFEKVHEKLAHLYDKPPKKESTYYKTDVSLIFSSDITQGWATSLGINQIVLYLESPPLGSFSRYDDWLTLLFTHEYTHILSLRIWDTDRSSLAFVRIFFGLPPNLASPRSLIEGVAVWEESRIKLDASPLRGRLNDPLTHMIARTAILEKNYPSLNEIINYPLDWPKGQIPYLYGARLMAEVERQGGEEAPRDYWSLDRLPLSLYSRFSDLGLELGKVYEGMRQRDLAYFGAQLDTLEKEGLTPYKRLTSNGYRKSFLTYDKEKKELLYYAAPSNTTPGVFRMLLTGQDLKKEAPKPEHIRRQKVNRGISSRKGKRFYSSDRSLYPGLGIIQELHDGNRSYAFSRMAKGRRISYPSLSADAKSLYFIEKKGEERLLKRASLQEEGKLGSEEVILAAKYQGILQYTAVSPNGSYLSFLWRPDSKGFAALVLCKLLKNKAEKKVESCRIAARAKGIITQPCFSKDSKELFFSSDIDGIYNLYALKVEAQRTSIHRLTRTSTGLFYPTATERALYAIAYFKNGYDIVRINYEELLNEEVDFFESGGPIPLYEQDPLGYEKEKKDESEEGKEKKKEDWKEGGYSSFLSWRPYYTGVLDLGKTAPLFRYFLGGIEARDPLEWHTLGFNLGLFSNTKKETNPGKVKKDTHTSVPAGLYYLYNRYKLGLSLSYLRDNEFSEIRQSYLSYISPGRFLSLQALAGYRQARYFDYSKKQFSGLITGESEEYILNGPSMILSLGDTQFFGSSISPERGWRFYAKAHYYTKDSSKRITGRHSLTQSAEREEPLDYGWGESALSLYLPSFFPYHVNYLSGKFYHYFGENPIRGYAETGNLVRNADPEAEEGRSFVAYTYEYRFPIFWGRPRPYLSLRHLNLAPFYDFGIVKDYQNRSHETWAYGLRIGFALHVFHIALPEISISISQGKDGERLYSLFFSTGNLSSGLGGGARDQRQSNPITRPLRPLPPQMNKVPGYF